MAFAGICLVVLWAGLQIWGDWHDEWSGYSGSHYISDGTCNIAVVPVTGEIHSYGIMTDDAGGEIVSANMSDVLTNINQAQLDPGILGIMTLIDSSGGTPVASEMITNELKKSSVPVAAFVLESAASGGYLVATGADTIIASPFSDIGSIGVTMSYLDTTSKNAEQGFKFVSLASGEFKDATNPDKPKTEAERALFKRDVAIMHEEFVDQVAENRNLPREDVAKLADGSTMPGKLALEAKLIDTLGTKETARAWFAEQLDLAPEEVIFCP